MGNQLFQQARRFTQEAVSASPEGQQQAIEKAKNALSSAYANSTQAEQLQLRELQTQLNGLNHQ